MSHDPLGNLRDDAGAGEVRSQRRPQSVKIDDVGLGIDEFYPGSHTPGPHGLPLSLLDETTSAAIALRVGELLGHA